MLTRENCTGSSQELETIRHIVPQELAPILASTEEQPVHLFVADSRDMHGSGVTHHLCRVPLPPESFLQLCPRVLVPSWPLYYALRCRDMPCLSDRLLLGMELCGSYSHLIVGDQTTATFYRMPSRQEDGSLLTRYDSPRIPMATTRQELTTFLKQAHGVRGAHSALEALSYVLDGSSSPGESILALMATLPCKKGGYGFKELELNPKVEVKAEQRHLTRTDSYHPDGYLRYLMTDLEYESNEFHTSSTAIARDKARRNAIQALGIEVKDVTWEMLSHIESLDLLFEQLLDKEHRMGQHSPKCVSHDNRAPYRRI